jgi:chromate reductase
MDILPLAGVPFYNQDLDGPQPPAEVAQLRAAIAAADGLVVCSPEYSFGMPGVLKNALDWAARPGNASVLKGKPVLVMSASPAFTGGARVHAQLRETFASTLSRVLVRPPVVIAGVHAKLQDGLLADQANLQFALEAVADLAAEIGASRRAAAPQAAPALA